MTNEKRTEDRIRAMALPVWARDAYAVGRALDLAGDRVSVRATKDGEVVLSGTAESVAGLASLFSERTK